MPWITRDTTLLYEKAQLISAIINGKAQKVILGAVNVLLHLRAIPRVFHPLTLEYTELISVAFGNIQHRKAAGRYFMQVQYPIYCTLLTFEIYSIERRPETRGALNAMLHDRAGTGG